MNQQAFDGSFDRAMAGGVDVTNLIEGVTGLEATLDDHYDLFGVDLDKRLQIRIDKNNAPREMVERFKFQMSLTQFPPIIVTHDGRIVDGNTRARAYWERETRFIAAYVLPVDYDEIVDDPEQQEMVDRLDLLGRILNNSNGKPLDRAERRDMVARGLRLGMTTDRIANTVGFKPATIASIRRELTGQARLAEVGLDELPVPSSMLGTLGLFSDLHDEPFVQVAQLAVDAGLPVADVKALAVNVAAAASDVDALRIIEHDRDRHAQRIADVKAGRASKPPQPRQLRQHLGFITARTADMLVETNPDEQQAHVDMVTQAMSILGEVLELMKAAP